MWGLSNATMIQTQTQTILNQVAGGQYLRFACQVNFWKEYLIPIPCTTLKLIKSCPETSMVLGKA